MAGDELFDRVSAVIENDQQDLIDLCLTLGNLPDLAGHERPVGEAVVAWFREAGIDARLQFVGPDSVNAIGTLRGTGDRAGGGRTLILNAHMDTEGGLPVGGPEEHRRLRGTWQEGDLLIGKGLVNDKAQLCPQMIATRAIKQAGITLKGDLIVTGVAQETGAPADEGAPGDVADPMVGPHVGEGFGTGRLIDHGVVADYALVGEPIGPVIATAMGGYVRLRVDVVGQMPYTPFIQRGPTLADNPNPQEKAAEVVVALTAWCQRYQEQGRYDYWGGTLIPRAQVQEIRTVNPPFTEMEDHCYIYLDVRLVPERNPLEIVDEVRQVIRQLGLECQVTPYDYKRGRVAEHAEALIEAVKEGHRRVFGTEPERASPARISMWEDVNAFNEAGIPAVVYGAPPQEEPYTRERMRAVRVVDLVSLAKVDAFTAMTICGVAAP